MAISREMKERIFKLRCTHVYNQSYILTKGNREEASKVARQIRDRYEKIVREELGTDLGTDEAFREWCKNAWGWYPEVILEGREEKTEREIVDWMNKKVDEAVAKLRSAGLKVTVIG